MAKKKSAMKRWWVSWWQPGEDNRPLNYPPNEQILGWWESGFTDTASSLCAAVLAPTEEEAKAAVAIDWPEAKEAEWRFCNEREPDFVPGDRFPLSEWMEPRFKAVT